jgi:hypothetical protein
MRAVSTWVAEFDVISVRFVQAWGRRAAQRDEVA